MGSELPHDSLTGRLTFENQNDQSERHEQTHIREKKVELKDMNEKNHPRFMGSICTCNSQSGIGNFQSHDELLFICSLLFPMCSMV